MPKISSELTSLIEPLNTTNISSSKDSHLGDIPTFDQSQYTLVVEPTSSDLVHDTLLTTQEPHLVGQGMHARAYPNDTNKNTEA